MAVYGRKMDPKLAVDASGSDLNKIPTSGGARRGKTMKASKMPAVGSKAQVYHGTAKHTSGGLEKKDLVKNKHGRIVSRKKMALGKKALKHLVKAGYKAKKGTFKLMKKH